MRFNKFLYTISFLLLFSCKKTKQETINPSSNVEEKKSLHDSSHSKNEDKIATTHPDKNNPYFTYEKWDAIHESEEIYQKAGLSIQLKSYLDQSKNIGGKKVYVNSKELDFIITDAYVLTPFMFVDGNEKILLIQEEDESGVYGYGLYYFNQEKFIKKEYLDIAAENTVEIDQFIRFKNEANSIIPIILTSKYYDMKLEQMKPSTEYSFVISKTPAQK